MERVDASDRHWGVWYLSQSTPLSLNVYLNWPDNGASYMVPLVKLNSEAKVLSWINHFIASGKRGIDVQAIRDFMRACKTLQKEGLMPAGEPRKDTNWGY